MTLAYKYLVATLLLIAQNLCFANRFVEEEYETTSTPVGLGVYLLVVGALIFHEKSPLHDWSTEHPWVSIGGLLFVVPALWTLNLLGVAILIVGLLFGIGLLVASKKAKAVEPEDAPMMEQDNLQEPTMTIPSAFITPSRSEKLKAMLRSNDEERPQAGASAEPPTNTDTEFDRITRAMQQMPEEMKAVMRKDPRFAAREKGWQRAAKIKAQAAQSSPPKSGEPSNVSPVAPEPEPKKVQTVMIWPRAAKDRLFKSLDEAREKDNDRSTDKPAPPKG